MGQRSDTHGCCSTGDSPTTLDDRLALGQRRLTALRWFAAWSSALLTVAALLVQFQVVPIDRQIAGRLALAAALFGVPKLFGHVRRALVLRRFTPPAVASLVLAVAALAGLALVVAVAVVTMLITDLVRQRRAPVDCDARQQSPGQLIQAS